MHSAPNNQAKFVTISINLSPIKRLVYHPAFWLAILAVIIVWRFLFMDQRSGPESGGTTKTQATRTEPLSTKLYAVKDAAGLTFKVNAPGRVRISVKDSSADNVLINLLDGPMVYSRKTSRMSRSNRGRETNFNEEIDLQAGTYVLTLVAKGGQSAQAFVDIDDAPDARD